MLYHKRLRTFSSGITRATTFACKGGKYGDDAVEQSFRSISGSNPLIVNKFVIAELETLRELIRLLTSSDSVEIDCNDIECSCTKAQYRTIKRIYITKDNELYNIQQCPILLKLFDNYKISLMFVNN